MPNCSLRIRIPLRTVRKARLGNPTYLANLPNAPTSDAGAHSLALRQGVEVVPVAPASSVAEGSTVTRISVEVPALEVGSAGTGLLGLKASFCGEDKRHECLTGGQPIVLGSAHTRIPMK